MSILPSISIVTPSFNQGQFLEETIRSVLDQNYPNLEYIIMDGGSTDNSLEIIKKYEKHLKYWQSQSDGGQYSAINKGFELTTGEIMAWINSSDKFLPGALHVVVEIFKTFPEIEWLTTQIPLLFDENGLIISAHFIDSFSKEGFLKGEFLMRKGYWSRGFIQQESTFWRRSLWERSGGCLNTNYKLAGDFELWARFFHHAELYGVYFPVSGFRMHPNQKTLNMKLYIDDAEKVFKAFKVKPYGKLESHFKGLINRFWPITLRKIAVDLGLLYPYKCVVFCGYPNRWIIKSKY